MNTFSIDYRSPPSGMGQIINPTLPNTPDNMILVSYEGCGSPGNPYYGGQIHFDNPEIEETGCLTSEVIDLLERHLVTNEVTEVYDSELGYDHPDKCDSRHHFKLKDWIEILKTQI